jgi:gluconolactonase
VEDVTPPELSASMLNGGVNFDDSNILLCAQGALDPNRPSGLIQVAIPSPEHDTKGISPPSKVLVSSFYGRRFNSVNDVIIHPGDRSIWFTDPSYGFHQGFKPTPQLPDQVYRFDPATESIRTIANGFTRCNGLCFSPDCKLLYVTDTGAVHGSPAVPFDPAGQSHIYVFDVVGAEQGAGPFLANRRLFAFADGICPDGIKCDEDGNVYSGCGDGIEIWNPAGVLIGRILVEGGVANFCFGEKGCLYLCNETRFWKVQLSPAIRGALLKL